MSTERGVFELIGDLTPVEPNDVKDFEEIMTNEVIPEIVRVLEERAFVAAQIRYFGRRFGFGAK